MSERTWTAGDNAAYRTVHSRLTSRRGRASDYPCVDCGKPAQDWSYDNTDPDERTSPQGLPYSVDLDHYEPRCKPCHAKFDGWSGRYSRSQPLACVHGHPFDQANTLVRIGRRGKPFRACRACARNRYHAKK